MTEYEKREIVLVTPEVAERWLNTNADYQRRKNKGDISAYAKMMAEGKWDENVPQAICFDTEGKLCDGQHRLEAIIESGKSIRFEVRRNMSKETFGRLDQGRKRTASDFISAKNASHISSLINRVLAMKAKRRSFSYLCLTTATRYEILREDIVSEYNKNSDYYDELVNKALKIYRNVRVAPPAAIAFAIWSEQILNNDEKMGDFIYEICNIGTTEKTVQFMKQVINNKRIAGNGRNLDRWGIGVFLRSYELYQQDDYRNCLNKVTSFLDQYDKRMDAALGGSENETENA